MVGNLKKDITTLTNKIKSTGVFLEMVQTGTKFLIKEIVHLKEDTNTFTNKTQSTEVLLEMVKTGTKLLVKEI